MHLSRSISQPEPGQDRRKGLAALRISSGFAWELSSLLTEAASHPSTASFLIPFSFFAPSGANAGLYLPSSLIADSCARPNPVKMALIEEKSSSSLSFLTDNAITAAITDTYSNLSEKRKALGLENPGTVDNISREVQREVLLSNYMFSGLRCDLQKIFSVAPLFRLQHGFAMGSQALPPWQLMALYGTPRV